MDTTMCVCLLGCIIIGGMNSKSAVLERAGVHGLPHTNCANIYLILVFSCDGESGVTGIRIRVSYVIFLPGQAEQ